MNYTIILEINSMLGQNNLISPEAYFTETDHRRLLKHNLIVDVMRSNDVALIDETLVLAWRQIGLWEASCLCSKDYIEEWKSLLSNPFAVADVLESKTSRAYALRQNSPFVSSVRRTRSAVE